MLASFRQNLESQSVSAAHVSNRRDIAASQQLLATHRSSGGSMPAGSDAANVAAADTAAARTGALAWQAAPPTLGSRTTTAGASDTCSAGPSTLSTCSALMTACKTLATG